MRTRDQRRVAAQSADGPPVRRPGVPGGAARGWRGLSSLRPHRPQRSRRGPGADSRGAAATWSVLPFWGQDLPARTAVRFNASAVTRPRLRPPRRWPPRAWPQSRWPLPPTLPTQRAPKAGQTTRQNARRVERAASDRGTGPQRTALNEAGRRAVTGCRGRPRSCSLVTGATRAHLSRAAFASIGQNTRQGAPHAGNVGAGHDQRPGSARRISSERSARSVMKLITHRAHAGIVRTTPWEADATRREVGRHVSVVQCASWTHTAPH